MFWRAFAMLLWLVFCAEITLALEDLYGDLWLYIRDNQHINAFVMMLSLGISRCAGRIRKTNGDTHKFNACGIGIYNAFDSHRFRGAGDLRFTMNSEENKC